MQNLYKRFQMRIAHFFPVLITVYIFSGCANKIALPTVNNHSYIKILEPIDGYYENKVGVAKKISISNYEFNNKYNLLTWAKDNYKTICFSTKICLIDALNNGYFSHSAIKGRDELYPLVKPVKYLEYTALDAPTIFHDQKVKIGVNIIFMPPLNSNSIKEVGESMYEKVNQFVFDTYNTQVNQKILNMELNKKYDLLVWPKNEYKTICEKNICLLDVNNSGIFNYYAIKHESEIFPLDKPFDYKSVQNITYNDDSFKYQVLYQGKIGNKIKISFREFKNDMVRPAFTQDIEYELELTKPTIIGFKGLRIEVSKATNQNITYSVIKDYN